MRILVTGKDGQVGRALARQAWPGAEVLFLGRGDCNLADADALREHVRRLSPRVIVNAAAYTAVDPAERERELCFAVNAVAPGVLAEEMARVDGLLIHYSTDYVFNGEKAGPYAESDAVQPLNVYGASKAAGEAAIAGAGARHLVLRTTWVYSAEGKNFLRSMLRLAAERDELCVVDDQIGAPTSAEAIAAATARLFEEYCRQSSFPGGTYHITASGSTSWCGFAQAIFKGSDRGRKPRVIPISTAEYPTPARRPKNSLLSNEKFERTFGFRLTSWQEQLGEVLAAKPLPG